jgi:hypothetical protein
MVPGHDGLQQDDHHASGMPAVLAPPDTEARQTGGQRRISRAGLRRRRPATSQGANAQAHTALHLFPGREKLSAIQPARNDLIRQLRNITSATQMALLGQESTRFNIRKTHLTWEPPYGIEP